MMPGRRLGKQNLGRVPSKNMQSKRSKESTTQAAVTGFVCL